MRICIQTYNLLGVKHEMNYSEFPKDKEND